MKGLNAQVGALSFPTCAPVVAAARLRKGNAVSGHGAEPLILNAVVTARAAGVSGQVMVRADSGYYRRDVHRRHGRRQGVVLGHGADETRSHESDRLHP